MRSSSKPKNENSRLKAIRRFNILDTQEEQDFDDIVDLLASIYNTPMALMTLLDSDRQWFKARKGFDIRESSRKIAFCAHTIKHDDVMLVADTHEDERFFDNPFVINNPNIRFYAGMPLITNDGYKIGAISILDIKPRTFTSEELNPLRTLARQVVKLLNLRHNLILLNESNKKITHLATVMERTGDAIVSIDADGIIKSWNRGAKNLFGYLSREISGRYIEQILGNKLQDLLSESKITRSELELNNKQGEELYLLISVTPLTNDLQDISGYVLQFRDISERKKLENELQKSNLLLKQQVEEKTSETKQIVERVSDAFIALDRNFKCIYLNKRAQSLIISKKDNLIGEKIWDKFSKTIGLNLMINSQEAMDRQKYQYIEIFDHDAQCWYEGHIYPSPSGVTLYFHDITEQKRSEEKLIKQFEELQKRNHELDQFVYSVSHDLRAPLASILGLINLAELEKPQEPFQEYFDRIKNRVNRLDFFIRDILNYSRNHRLELQVEKVDFHKIVDEIKSHIDLMDAAENIDFEINIENGIPFYSDSTRILIVLNNLLINAVKYSDSNKERSFVKVEVITHPENTSIKIKDNGIGIAPDQIPKIYDMFYRATACSTGSGLGLYIAREAISKLGGKIDVESKQGEFTTFRIILPNLNPE